MKNPPGPAAPPVQTDSCPAPAAPPALVVSASPGGRAGLEEALRGGGYAVRGAASASEAVRLVEATWPRVVLVEEGPPSLSAAALCPLLRETEPGRLAYLLLVSDPVGEERLAAALDGGADDYLLKPFGPLLLRARLRSGARLAEARRQALSDEEELRQARQAAAPGGPNRREAFRVRVAADSGLRVLVAGPDGPARPARALDVSLTGLLLEPAAGGESGWEPGKPLVVELYLGNDSVRISAVVLRRKGLRHALTFPGVVAAGDIDPPEGLRRVVTGLERHWLRTRAATARS